MSWMFSHESYRPILNLSVVVQASWAVCRTSFQRVLTALRSSAVFSVQLLCEKNSRKCHCPCLIWSLGGSRLWRRCCLSAAFECRSLGILCRRLELSWTSFSGHISTVVHSTSVMACMDHLSSSPAGSGMLSPRPSYTADLTTLIEQHSFCTHFYTDYMLAPADRRPHRTFGSVCRRA